MLKKFISFENMITPTIIKILFWVGIGVSGISAIITFFTGIAMMFDRYSSGFGGFIIMLSSIIVFALGILFSRIYCELLIVIFKIHESLASINNKMK